MHNSQYKAFILFILIILPLTTSAGMFKCTDSRGKVTFQATPCAANSKETTLNYQRKKVSQSTQCLPKCRSSYMVCLGNQGSSKDRDTGMELCKKSKKACEINCSDPKKGEMMVKQAEYERKRFEADKRYEKKMQAYERQKEQRREGIEKEIQGASCQWYRNQLTQAKQAWQNKKKDGYTPHDKRRYEDWIDNAQRNVNNHCG